jgi:hypothetical protein
MCPLVPTLSITTFSRHKYKLYALKKNAALGIRDADHVAPSIRKSWQPLRRQAAVARSV